MKKSNFSIIKLLIFLMLFLVVLTIFLIVYIIPVMKEYKTNQVVLKKYEKIYDKEKGKLKYLEAKRDIIKKKYKDVIIKYETPFDEKKFEKLLEKNIFNLKIDEKKLQNKTKVKIEGNIKNIENFLDLIDKINNYKNIVKIIFPIEIKKNEMSYFISFYVTILNKDLKKNL